MRKLILISILFLICSCKKASVTPVSSAPISIVSTTATITYKLSIQQSVATGYFINTYNVYGSGITVRDSMTTTVKSYSFTAKQGTPNKQIYLFQWQHFGSANQPDSIRLQILLNGTVKRDTIVDGWTNGGLNLYY